MSENRRKSLPERSSPEAPPRIGSSRIFSARDSASKELEQSHRQKSQRIFMSKNDMYEEELEEV